MALNGIDVSGWQPADIASMVDYDFIFIKATQGNWFVSKRCDTQYQQAKKRGKLLGFYHFADGGNPEEEAEFFYNNTKNYFGEAIPVLDFEYPATGLWGDNEVLRFLDHLYKISGVRALIYTGVAEANRLQKVANSNYGLWLAHWGNQNKYPGGYREPHKVSPGLFPFVVIHQYMSRGQLEGYAGALDLNKAYITAEQWAKYANPQGTSAAPVPEEQPTAEAKSIHEIAREVWEDQWGIGAERSQRLRAAGYDPEKVREEVNRIAPEFAQPRTYTVKPGDTLSAIAAANGTTWQALQRLNYISNPNLIRPGQVLHLS